MNVREREQAFSDRIDCNFPYDDDEQIAALITEAGEVSPNATFILLYEIVCVPESVRLPEGAQRRLLAKCASAFPSQDPVIELAYRVLNGGELSMDQTLALIREIGSDPHQPAALAVISHLVYAGLDEAERALIDALEQEIRSRWESDFND